VPLSIWEIAPDSEVALIEAGVSEKGEMRLLQQAIRPDTVIFTNIGDAHTDGLGSPEEKAAEKAVLAENASTVIFCSDHEVLLEAIAPLAARKEIITWSRKAEKSPLEGCRHFIMREADKTNELWEAVTDNGIIHIAVPLKSDAEVENAANAIAFMLHKGFGNDVIAESTKNLHKIATRLNVSEGVNGCQLIFDSYTSDFSSLPPAIHFMMRRKMPHQSSVAIISDIEYETDHSSFPYQRIAETIRENGVDRFIGIGEEMSRHRNLFPEGSAFFLTTDDFLSAIHPSDFVNEIILMKGAPRFGFARINELLEARKHETVLEVNLDALVRNYNYFRSHLPSGTGIVAMVKASGYGAGSYEIAKTLQDCGAAYLAVAVLDEGIDLRRNGIKMPIMVMNPKVVNYRSMFSNRLEPEIFSLEMLKDVVREAEKNGMTDYPIHLNNDTA
ncbi:MAG: alanine racemase, partial [Muribaculaceae bacterium]|nr:alanine racemase [Muribaculaceae bacterium]